ncbi:hypothetical protein PMAYCL1PPCAC_01465, partial [Pristionchus mayeri]
ASLQLYSTGSMDDDLIEESRMDRETEAVTAYVQEGLELLESRMNKMTLGSDKEEERETGEEIADFDDHTFDDELENTFEDCFPIMTIQKTHNENVVVI